MIEFPPNTHMAGCVPTLVDAGFTQRGLGSLQRIERKGTRYKLACTFGPFTPEIARVMVARLIRGKQEGVRLPYPLQHSQGSPGAPLLNGAVSTGREIVLDGLTAGYVCKEGYWLSLVKDGRHYLHNVKTGGMANASGQLTITLNEMVRNSFADNTVVHLAKPMVEGLVEGDEWAWSLSVDRVTPIEFTLEEVR